MEEKDAALGFSNSVGVGPKSFQRLLKVYGSAKCAWEEVTPEKYKAAGIGKLNFEKFIFFRDTFNHEVYNSMLIKAQVKFIPFADKYYPESLKKLDSPPIGLFVKGNLELLTDKPSPQPSPKARGGEVDFSLSEGREKEREGQPSGMVIGVVGARKITGYGSQVTSSLVSELCSFGFIIASGMALGVDAIAHATAIENHGLTIAVLGCGVDCAYPRENQDLYEKILDNQGLIISEYPLGMPAGAGTFPARNRIIAGISSSVLITEAAEDSGSLIAADHAFVQGKPVFAIPGPITSVMSRGSLKLLKGSAVLVQSGQDILDTLNINVQDSKNKSMKDLKSLNLGKDEVQVYQLIEQEERSLDELSRLTKIPLSKLSAIVSGMELRGLINISSGVFRV